LRATTEWLDVSARIEGQDAPVIVREALIRPAVMLVVRIIRLPQIGAKQIGVPAASRCRGHEGWLSATGSVVDLSCRPPRPERARSPHVFHRSCAAVGTILSKHDVIAGAAPKHRSAFGTNLVEQPIVPSPVGIGTVQLFNDDPGFRTDV